MPSAVVEAAFQARLYEYTLGDPPVTSYEGLIEWDVDQLVQALR